MTIFTDGAITRSAAAAGCVLLLVGSFSESNRYDSAWSTTKSGDPLFFVSFVPETRFSFTARSENAFVRERSLRQTAYTALLSSVVIDVRTNVGKRDATST